MHCLGSQKTFVSSYLFRPMFSSSPYKRNLKGVEILEKNIAVRSEFKNLLNRYIIYTYIHEKRMIKCNKWIEIDKDVKSSF